jgi:MFS family permease
MLAIWSFAAFSSQASAMANLQGYFLQAPVYGKTLVEVSYSVCSWSAFCFYSQGLLILGMQISAALAGLIVGAMLVVPISRRFGSCFCLLWSTLGVLITGIWSACMTSSGAYNAFVISCLFAGIFASVPLILGSQCVLDIFFLYQRGRVFHIIHIPYLLGVVAGPTFGGYVVSRTSWPVQFWWTVGMNGFLIILILVLLENTEYDCNNNGSSKRN